MNASALALVGYVAWFLAVLAVFAVYRTALTMKGKPANSFTADGSDVGPFGRRLTRVHANLFENAGIVAGVLLLAIVTGHARVTDPLAPWFLGARVAQSLVHLASTSVPAVTVRFVFFVIQWAILVWWTFGLYGALTA